MASCVWDLWGKVPLFLSLLPVKSTVDIRIMPANEARVPISFLAVNLSTLRRAPKINVQMPEAMSSSYRQDYGKDLLLVDVRMVELATVVYSRHAATK